MNFNERLLRRAPRRAATARACACGSSAGAAAGCRGRVRAPHRGDRGADRAQPPAHAHVRVQLRRAGRARRRGARDRARRRPRAGSIPDKIDERTIAPPPLRARHARPRPARAHVGRVPDLELPAVGARVLGARTSPTCCGPTSAASTSSTRSPSSSAASAASAPCELEPRSRTHRRITLDVMPGLYRDEGVVLRTIKLGEADRIVTIFTQGHGKIRAVAKGDPQDDEQVRRPARADEPGRAAVLQGPRARHRHPGRDARIEPGAARGVRAAHARDPDARSGRPGRPGREPNPALYRMLTGALRALGRRRRTRSSRPRSSGSCSRSRASTRCSTRAPAAGTGRSGAATTRARSRSISTEGGALCRACARGGGRPLSPGGLALLRRVLGGGLNGVLAEPPGPAAHEVEQLGIRALEHHVERRMRSTVAALDAVNRRFGHGSEGRPVAWFAMAAARLTPN